MEKKYLEAKAAVIEKELRASGMYDLRNGLFLETGESLEEQQKGWDEQDSGKAIDFGAGEIWLTADNVADNANEPEFLGLQVDEALNELADKKLLPTALCAYRVEVIRECRHCFFDGSWSEYHQTEDEARRAFAKMVEDEKLQISMDIAGKITSDESIRLYSGDWNVAEPMLDVKSIRALLEAEHNVSDEE